VESDRAACDALRENLASRSITHVKVVNTDAASAVRAIKKRVPAVVMDPPRAGAPEASEVFAKTPPDRLVYVSCDPPTLGRDLAVLTRAMTVEQIAGFEMFPQTAHVETAVLLTRTRG
jgi:23S rRNA (uracil1939-C5)-methyltransferase